ncbi:MAG TPA: saccharopine dehydrogenase NADP-binding domain-containing protein [Symbiobacteriaceae bacterium]|nr:saccharopine dehydrogenase NADP-binding domain-containing protein [Symbiobacteriaceae bacterium]
MHQGRVITILGSAGGVARAVLALLNHAAQDVNDPLHAVINQCHLHLVDRKKKPGSYYRKLLPGLQSQFTTHQFNLANLPRFREHLRQTQTTIVIDVSWADTLEMLRCCNGLGIAYVNTALENRIVDEHEETYKGFPLMERLRVMDHAKEDFTNTTAILCSGMNPGVVQWMALELMKDRPGETPLGCYIVEHDSSFFANPSLARPESIYTTWAPECFLDEAILSFPMFMNHHTPVFLHEPVYALEFKVTLGAKQFDGCLMPHEEVYTLCKHYAMEGGFLYKINAHTTDLIRAHLDRQDDLWDLEMQVLDPTRASLAGEDLVGVLLVYRDKERYMYNVLTNQETFARFGVNATYFQVASGVYGALATLLLDSIPQGIYYVDELLRQTGSRYGVYVTHCLRDFVVGENDRSDGLLLQRMKRVDV